MYIKDKVTHEKVSFKVLYRVIKSFGLFKAFDKMGFKICFK